MTAPVYILARVPGATNTVEWTDICHSKADKIFIGHKPLIHIGRHGAKDRKRPFIVYWRTHAAEMSAHKTLEAAIKAANKFAKEKNS